MRLRARVAARAGADLGVLIMSQTHRNAELLSQVTEHIVSLCESQAALCVRESFETCRSKCQCH